MSDRTRYWASDHGSDTAVQFRTDVEPEVWMHTNMGWVPIGNCAEEGHRLACVPTRRVLSLMTSGTVDCWIEVHGNEKDQDQQVSHLPSGALCLQA